MQTRLANYVKAGYPALYLVSHEELRMEHLVKSVAEATGRRLYAWSLTSGRDLIGGSENIDLDYLAVLSPRAGLSSIQHAEGEEGSILMLRDYHLHLNDGDAAVIRNFKDAIAYCKEHLICLVIIGADLKLPLELSKLVTVVNFDLPDRDTLQFTLQKICETNDCTVPEGDDLEAILDAAGGLTTTEAEDAFALSLVETSTIHAPIIQREKSGTLKKNGILELVENTVTLDQIGGLENFKADLLLKRHNFSKAAREYGLPTPRGCLAVGQAGTGKSLLATATSSIFGIPLIRLEASRLFGSHVGESEGNWRTAFATAKAISPGILWIDEVDGLFSGAESSGKTDGGTTSRVIKAILQDMQFNGQNIFFMFTANDIDGIPDPLIDRLDVWNVDLPHATEREAIWKIHIAKRNRNPLDFDIRALADATDGFSGRQIEQVWLKAMTAAFNERREPTTIDAHAASIATIPTSKTMATQIEARRRRLEGRAQPASTPPPSPNAKLNGTRKLSLAK